jgi:hypothetical protein
MMAILPPRFGKRGLDDGASMPAPLKVAMGYNILDDPMLTATSEEVGNRCKHARRNDTGIRFGHKDEQTVARESPCPNFLGPFVGLNLATDLRRGKQSQQRGEVGMGRDSGNWHC